jgi:hypothetical protein
MNFKSTSIHDTLLVDPPHPTSSDPSHAFQTYANRKSARERNHKNQVVECQLPIDVQRFHTRTAIRKILHNPNTRAGKIFPHLKATPGPSRFSLSMKPLSLIHMDVMDDDVKKVHGLLRVEGVDKSSTTSNIGKQPEVPEVPARISLKQLSGSTTSYSKFLLSQRDVPTASPLSSTTHPTSSRARPTPTTSARIRRPRPASAMHEWTEHALAERLLSNLDLEPVKDTPYKQSREYADDEDISAYSVPIVSSQIKQSSRPVASSNSDFIGTICAWEAEEECECPATKT